MHDLAGIGATLRTDLGLSEAATAKLLAGLEAGQTSPEALLLEAGLELRQIAEVLAGGLLDDTPETPDETMMEPVETVAVQAVSEPSVDDLMARLLDITARFELQGEIARGAMGRILAGWDLHLGRPVAIKVLRKGGPKDLDRVRFLEEAQVTGQLQHPSIMPVYELGRIQGQVAFVMRRIEGRSLKQVISELRKGLPSARQKYGVPRLVSMFHQLCLAVAFAHRRGVVHRDLKPSNVMVGDFGELVLLDWGLCKIIGGETRSTRSTNERWKTVHGQIIGTPAYMAPEQAMGMTDQIDARTDVYGLGAILYHLLTLRPPFAGKTNREIVQRVLRETVKPCRERAPRLQVPKALEAICMRCLSRRPDERYPDARAVADAVAAYLAGADDTHRAPSVGGLVQEAVAAITRRQSLQEDAALIRDDLAIARAAFDATDPPSMKAAAWEAEARLRAVSIEVADALALALARLGRAVAIDPNHTEARRLLTDLRVAGLEAAQRLREPTRIAACKRALRECTDVRGSGLLRGKGALHVETHPAGARISVSRFVERTRRMVAPHAEECGVSPVALDALTEGAYRLQAHLDGRAVLTTSVVIKSGRATRLRLSLLPSGGIPSGFIHIPAGNFYFGSPYDAYLPPTEHALPDFLISMTPVTAGAYLRFINALHRTEPSVARRRVPRGRDGRSMAWVADNHTGEWRLPDGHHPGGAWRDQMPVVGISVHDAEAFCRYFHQTHGHAVRLPTEIEWEKAARGAEGRRYPWGDEWVPGYAMVPGTWTGLWPPPVGHATEDRSSCGVWDCAGGVREWTATIEDRPRRRHGVRGGSFMTAGDPGRSLFARAYAAAQHTAPDLGFRLVLDLSAEGRHG